MSSHFSPHSPARRRLIAMVGVTAAMLTLCGCGGAGASSAAGQKAGNCTLSPQVTDDKPITGEPSGTITFQTTALGQDNKQYFDNLIKAFEKKYPKVTVKWQDDPGDATFTQRLVGDAQACTLPDVVNLNQQTAYALYQENFLLDLSKKAPDAGKDFTKSIYDSLTFPGSKDHYVMPWYWGMNSIATYNTALMSKAGLDPSKPPTTIEQQFADAEQIAQNAHGQFYAFDANPFFRLPNDWEQMGVKITNADQTKFTFASDPKAQEWTKEWVKLYQEGAMPKDTISSQQDPSTYYAEGELVWSSPNLSNLKAIQKAGPSVYATTATAPLLDSLGTAIEDGQLIGVASTSKNPSAAIAFAEFLLDPDNQAAFVSDPSTIDFPSTTQSLDIPKFQNNTGTDPISLANKLAAQLAPNAQNEMVYPWSDSVQNAIVSEIQNAMLGKKDPQQALNDAQNEANNILADAAGN